ncbi:hypothetical protein NL676_005396 [Syzygium grande]|nr:hypothetical protein NL676_005396 [Syzygium grande]
MNAIDDGAKLERTVTILELSRAEQSARLEEEEEEATKRFEASLMSQARCEKALLLGKLQQYFRGRPLISSSCGSFQFSVSTSRVGEEYMNER